ncbi:unnamed protein product [Lactuca saligna]|uniref:Uncharacterized protein n=1 Tax=Lactuca saligna TaxID=75948 RepID=A0AA36A3S6_LACSI|nr:unnamed protein product [Lactuca saligna]
MMAGKLIVFLFHLAVALSLTSHSSSLNFTVDDPIDSDGVEDLLHGSMMVGKFIAFLFLALALTSHLSFNNFSVDGVEDLLHGSIMAGKFIIFLFLLAVALLPTSLSSFDNFSVDGVEDLLHGSMMVGKFIVFLFLALAPTSHLSFHNFSVDGVEDLLRGSIMAGKFIIFLFLLRVELLLTSHSSFYNFSVDVTIDSGVLGAILICMTSCKLPKRLQDMYDEDDFKKDIDISDCDYSLPTQQQTFNGVFSEDVVTFSDLQSTENPIPMVEEYGLLSKNRKLDGFLGRECNSASSTIDHKSSGEQQLAMENVKSNQSKAARANSHDECAKDEMMNINENSKNEDVDIQDENVGGTVSLASCLSKQGDKDFATWPRDPHRNVEYQISISQFQSNDIIQRRVDDDMLVGFLKRKNSLHEHELQAIEDKQVLRTGHLCFLQSKRSNKDGKKKPLISYDIDASQVTRARSWGSMKECPLGATANHKEDGMEVNGKDDDLKTPLLNPSDVVAIDSKSIHSVNQGIKTITFKIGGIEYASCSSSNESLLVDLNGVSPLQGQGVVSEHVDVEAIKETIEDAGFEVKEFSNFEVNSKKMLDPVTMCPRESDGLALNQSSECCILVKPKQLKFHETDGCNSNKGSSLLSRIRELLGSPSMNMDYASLKDDKTSEQQLKSAMIRSHEDFDVCTSTETMNIDLDLDLNPLMEESLLPKNRKLDGFLGQECNSASTIVDHKSSEKQLPMENVESNKSKVAMTRSQDNFDECAKDEMMDMDEYRMVEDVEHNP